MAIAILAGFVSLTGPATAQAVPRYADPAGSGTACTEAAPCSLQQAVEAAAASDEVVVAPGTYNEGSDILEPSSSIVIRGDVSGPEKPLIVSTASTGVVLSTGSVMRDMSIEHSGSKGLSIGTSAEANRVEVVSNAVDGACAVTGGTFPTRSIVRNSFCVSTGSGPALLASATLNDVYGVASNVTAVATGPNGVGVLATSDSNSFRAATLELRNVIAQGSSADIRATTTAANAIADVDGIYNNFQTATSSGPGTEDIPTPGGGGNQIAQPLFADAANGDFHENPSSPTIDAGQEWSFTDEFDFDGEDRTLGVGVDIGADEVEEADTTAPETTIGKTSLSANGTFKVKFAAPGEPDATFECKLDKGAFKPCNSPKSYKKLDPGRHKVQVRATDLAGNTESPPAVAKFRVPNF